jgi:hypothetical protein
MLVFIQRNTECESAGFLRCDIVKFGIWVLGYDFDICILHSTVLCGLSHIFLMLFPICGQVAIPVENKPSTVH